MPSYIGRHAELYDLFYASKPYAEEAAFVHHCLDTYAEGEVTSLVELACGTGSHALELAKLGYQIVATDYSPGMIAQAQHKNTDDTVDFRQADMRDLTLPEAPFDAAYSLFDSIGYVASNEGLKQVFNSVRRQVRPGGLFIFEFWHAAAMLADYDPLRVRRWQTNDGEILRISETQLEVDKQLAHVTYHIYELWRDGRYSHLEETQTNRYFLLGEMQFWLEQYGFSLLKTFAGFTDSETIDADTWHIVAVARREES